MASGRSLKRIHAHYLESSRNLAEGRRYWADRSVAVRILEFFSPVPFIALQGDGPKLLEALTWLESNCRGPLLGVDALLGYHRMLGGDGAYRKGQASVRDSRIARPPAHKVSALMMQLDGRLAQEQRKLDALPRAERADVLKSALDLHQRLAFIHPFADANGRVARLAMNHLLRRYGHGYVILPPLAESPEHHQALEEAHGGNLAPFLELAERHYQAV